MEQSVKSKTRKSASAKDGRIASGLIGRPLFVSPGWWPSFGCISFQHSHDVVHGPYAGQSASISPISRDPYRRPKWKTSLTFVLNSTSDTTQPHSHGSTNPITRTDKYRVSTSSATPIEMDVHVILAHPTRVTRTDIFFSTTIFPFNYSGLFFHVAGGLLIDWISFVSLFTFKKEKCRLAV